MRIDNVTLPDICDYYIKNDKLDYIKECLKGSKCNIKDSTVLVTRDQDKVLLQLLHTIKSKSEKIAIGDKSVYVYELDLSVSDGHLFELKIGKECYKATIYSINNDIKGKMRILFKI